MSIFKTYMMPNSSILRINSDTDLIDKEPDYQRKGDIWPLEKRQLLIDSILNDFDIPKLYFHLIPDKWKRKKSSKYFNAKHFSYAIVDGRQRIETIWKFINGDFPLATDFTYLQDKEVNAGGLTYSDLAKKYPRLKTRFDSFVLPIVCIETDVTDLIEDMFLRLNEAVALNATEKRNAIGGPMAKLIKEVSAQNFFKRRVKFANNRYQHMEVATRLLFIEYSLITNKKIYDTKKMYLDAFVYKYKKNKRIEPSASVLGEKVKNVLSEMETFFTQNDELLKTQAIIPIYYLLFRQLAMSNYDYTITRNKLLKFRQVIIDNRNAAAEDMGNADYDYLEFDRMSVQGTNDSTSIRERYRILKDFLELKMLPDFIETV